MVCLGLVFGCSNPSVESYVVSGLVIIGIVAGLRILCYTIYKLLNGPEHHSGESSSNDDEIEMQTRSWNQERAQQCAISLPESKLVILAGESRASFIAQPVPFPTNSVTG